MTTKKVEPFMLSDDEALKPCPFCNAEMVLDFEEGNLVYLSPLTDHEEWCCLRDREISFDASQLYGWQRRYSNKEELNLAFAAGVGSGCSQLSGQWVVPYSWETFDGWYKDRYGDTKEN